MEIGEQIFLTIVNLQVSDILVFHMQAYQIKYTYHIKIQKILYKKPYESSYLRRTFPQLSIFLNTIHF